MRWCRTSRGQLRRIRGAGPAGVSCMNGAISDGMFNIFFKLHFQKTYDGILATPMRVPDVAFGEMLWALTRGSIYAGADSDRGAGAGRAARPGSCSRRRPCWHSPLRSCRRVVLGDGTVPHQLHSEGGRLRHGDGAAGDADVSLQRDLFPATQLPEVVQWLFQIVPLFHAVELLRALTTGAIGEAIWWHVAFLVGGGLCAFVVAMRRLERALIK